jgi:hypothetical protein
MGKMQVFTKDQLIAIEQGQEAYNQFVDAIKSAVSGDYKKLFKKHWIFSSVPGITKTTTILRLLDEAGLPYYVITGKKSMRDLGYQLAFIKAHATGPVIIFIDDCDFIFKDIDTMNIFKNVIGKMRQFEYSNHTALQGIKELPKPMQQAVLKYRSKDGAGFCVPTDDIHFIIATNSKLPTEDEAVEFASKHSAGRGDIMMSKAALADRMNNYHIDFKTWQENWGYVAHRILENPYFGEDDIEFSLEQRQQMCLFTWSNFNKLKSKSFRLYEGLAQEMLLHPDNYLDIWNSSKYLNLDYKR